MGKKNPRVDAYIAKSAKFARPILKHLRTLVHAACPEVEETLKWSAPHFMYKGVLFGMAGFKNHCAFGFWKGEMLFPDNPQAMRNFARVTSLSDLPRDEIIIALVKEAARSNAAGEKKAAKPRRAKQDLPMPEELSKALKKSPKAMAAFENFSPSHKREYVEWITDAKTDDTRTRRLVTAIEWIAGGKPRNWKYMKEPVAGKTAETTARVRSVKTLAGSERR